MQAAPPIVPSNVKGSAGVKAYLLKVLDQITVANADLTRESAAYAKLIADNGGTPESAAKAQPQQMAELILQMRDAYQRIDSFGYEYIEGIVAGVPALMKYDAELDAGIPAKGAGVQDVVANVVIHAGDITIDHEGSLNNYLIEPTVFGTNERFTKGVATLPGFSKPVNLPNPVVISALADYSTQGYARLKADADAWQPSDKDCCHVVANMTPTLADYFDDWKETKKYGMAKGGRFVAVSRLSDMRGIMSSTQLAWLAVADKVHAKDAALADKISLGYQQILQFINTIDAREQKKPLKIETIDALGTQAKEKADKVTVQGDQAAALLGIDVNAK